MYSSKAKTTSSKETASKRANYLIFIVGPTASGKSTFAMLLAKKYSLEIISADSRQFYKSMTIGTAKPSSEDQAAVTHHFVDCREISRHLNAGDFEKEVLKILPGIFERNNVAIVCGGSGLYLNALAFGLDDLPRSDAALRERLEARLSQNGIQDLLNELKTLDPKFYDKVDKANSKRVIRALEVCLLSGSSYTELRKAYKKERPFKTIWIGIERPREELYSRINERVEEMMEKGLLKEAESLAKYRDEEAMKTVGYSELFSFFDGKISLQEAIGLIKRNSRRYAKRQMTWFRRNNEINWINPENELPEGLLPFESRV